MNLFDKKVIIIITEAGKPLVEMFRGKYALS